MKALDTDNVTGIIKSLFHSYGINFDYLDRILSAFRPLKLRKNEFFSEHGKRSTRLGILLNGILVAKYLQKDQEIVSRFYYSPRNIIVSSFESFKTGSTSTESIQAIEDTYLVTISRDDLFNIYDEIPEMNLVGRQFAEQSYILALQRIHQLQTMSVKEKLERFYEDHPELSNKIKIQDLCSYLGANRNALSREMNKKSK